MQLHGLRRRTLYCVAFVTLVFLLTALPAKGWAASWTFQTLPSPALSSSLEGATCVAEPACVAVGKEWTNKQAQTFMWNGASWSATGQPYPAGATSSTLADVSCTAALACTAVGRYVTGGIDKPYAARFTGSWTVQTVPLPEGATVGALNDVVCTSVNACIGVGFYRNASNWPQTFVTVWDGSKWTVQSSPNTSSSKWNELFGISCSSATACTAVGAVDLGSIKSTLLALRWDGKSWALQEVGLPPGVTGGRLNAVSCTSASSCFGVGRSYLEISEYPYSEKRVIFVTWNGTKWSVAKEPSTSVWEASFDDISCTSATACVGVGKTITIEGATQRERRFAADWNGAEWTIHAIANPASNAFLTGVFCFAAAKCEAVGTGPGAVAAKYE